MDHSGELIARAPAGPLRGHVRSYYGFWEKTSAPLRRREGPGVDVVLVLSFGNEWRIGETFDPERPLGRYTSFVAGLHETAVLTEHDGWSGGMQINIAPQTAHALFRLPMDTLAGRTVPLEAILGAEALQLVDRLADARGWDARFTLLDATLAERLAAARPPSPEVAWAWRRLAETHGSMRIAPLADELGWSRRRLVARFRDEIGLPPKTVARMHRFERAAQLLERGAGAAETAFACGYYDQSHLINDFRAIAGVTPAALAAA